MSIRYASVLPFMPTNGFLIISEPE
jgi:hypothetical protein